MTKRSSTDMETVSTAYGPVPKTVWEAFTTLFHAAERACCDDVGPDEMNALGHAVDSANSVVFSTPDDDLEEGADTADGIGPSAESSTPKSTYRFPIKFRGLFVIERLSPSNDGRLHFAVRFPEETEREVNAVLSNLKPDVPEGTSYRHMPVYVYSGSNPSWTGRGVKNVLCVPEVYQDVIDALMPIAERFDGLDDMMAEHTAENLAGRFADYVEANPDWGPLRPIIDGGVSNRAVIEARDQAFAASDIQGAILGSVILRMKRSERRLLGGAVEAFLEQRREDEPRPF